MTYPASSRLQLQQEDRALTGLSGKDTRGESMRYRRVNQAELRREHGLDRTLAETFPCSDPLSSIPDPYMER